MGELIKFPENSPKAFLRNLYLGSVRDIAIIYTDDAGDWFYTSFDDVDVIIQTLLNFAEALKNEQSAGIGE